MKTTLWVYLALLVFGLIVLAWPEENNLMYIKLSETHGPSKLDLAGLLIMTMGYAPMILQVLRTSGRVMLQTSKKQWYSLVSISILALGSVALSLVIGNDVMLWISVLVSTLAQGILVFHAFSVGINSK